MPPPLRSVHHHKSVARNWDKSQDWVSHGEENRHSEWKQPAGLWMPSGPTDQHLKLETVHENSDDNVSETHSELTTIPHLGRATSCVDKGSSGSYSDPGDSHGGREYGDVPE